LPILGRHVGGKRLAERSGVQVEMLPEPRHLDRCRNSRSCPRCHCLRAPDSAHAERNRGTASKG
jgi:hypothetical protein